jgi:quinol monooxygenase YgiN
MVRVGLLVRIEARPGKEDEVAGFLERALAMVQDETATMAWFAIRFGPSSFGIFDAFPDEAGREAHLNGRVAEALLGSVGDLIEQPQIEQVDVLAAKTLG